MAIFYKHLLDRRKDDLDIFQNSCQKNIKQTGLLDFCGLLLLILNVNTLVNQVKMFVIVGRSFGLLCRLRLVNF